MPSRMYAKLSLFFALALMAIACSEPPPSIPKPRAYPRVIYPEKKLVSFNEAQCPFTTRIPMYFKTLKDSLQTGKEKDFNCWYDLYCEELNGYLHMSYVPITSRRQFDGLVNDAFEMADKHNIKASYRQESVISHEDRKLYGLIFEIDGPVATPLQFFVTDSTEHFLRASLYFKSAVNRDSIAPVYDFLREDVYGMIEGLAWR